MAENENDSVIATGHILKQIDLERFSVNAIEENNKKYQILLAKMLDVMSHYVKTGGYNPAREAQLRQLNKELIELLNEEYKESVMSLQQTMEDTADISYRSTAQNINSLYGIDLVRGVPSKELISVLVSRSMIQGAPQKEFWKRQTELLRLAFMSQLRIGLVQGETLNQIVQRVRGNSTGKRFGYKTKDGKQRYAHEFTGGVMATTTRQAESLIRTSVNTVSNNTNEKLYEDNLDVIGGVRLLVTLDTRTSPVCQSRAGNYWSYDEQGNLSGITRYPGPPPYHFNCRSILIPVVRSLDEIVKRPVSSSVREKAQQLIANPTKQTSMSGKLYDINKGYEGWLRDQSKSTQLEVLGKGRYDLWKKNKKLTVKQMVDQTGRPLTIRELREKYKN